MYSSCASRSQEECSALAQAWNEQRFQVVATALEKVLYPQLAKELRLKLLDEAKESVIRVCPLHS